LHQRRTLNNIHANYIYKESKQALRRTQRRDKTAITTPAIQERPRRSSAQYQREKEFILTATPNVQPNVPSALPNYITQDDDEANLTDEPTGQPSSLSTVIALARV
jgi:hypothetical protein